MTRRPCRERRGDRGTLAVELAVLTPVLLMLMLLVVAAGKVVEMRGQVDAAARDASRAASLVRYSVPAGDAAQAAAAQDLGRTCIGGPRAMTDTSQWQPGGQVTVTVRCQISMAAVTVIGFNATFTITGSATVPLEQFRRVQAGSP